jgi:hypothetical protein
VGKGLLDDRQDLPVRGIDPAGEAGLGVGVRSGGGHDGSRPGRPHGSRRRAIRWAKPRRIGPYQPVAVPLRDRVQAVFYAYQTGLIAPRES